MFFIRASPIGGYQEKCGILSSPCEEVKKLMCHASPFLRHKLQGNTVITPPLAGRWGAIIEDMSLMTSASGAVVFGAGPNQLEIKFCFKPPINACEEARPPGAAVVFHLRTEQRQLAAGTDKGAFLFVLIKRA